MTQEKIYLVEEKFWSYEKSKSYMTEYKPHIKTKAQYVKDVQRWAEGFIPKRPNKTYKGNGWISWEDFLSK